MSDIHHDTSAAGDQTPVLLNRTAEIAVALLTMCIGIVVMTGSYEQGIGWSDSGPDAGYFPFYIGLIMSAASLGTIAFTLAKWRSLASVFVERGPFRHVVAVFVPICIYVIGIRLLGMYIASPLFIAWFMWREKGEQRHGLLKIVLIPVAVTVAAYLIFERWFQVPLYTGPVFAWLGVGR